MFSPLLVVVWFAAGVVLTNRFLLVEGKGAWAAWAAAAVLLAGSTVYQYATVRGRQLRRDRAGLVHALTTHTDPGPQLRERADRMAAGLARLRWVLYLLPLLVLGFLPYDHEQPWTLLVVAGVVLVAVPVAGAVVLGRQVGAARRWLVDPPGPARGTPEPRPVDRWLTGRRLLLVGCGVAVAAAGLGVLLRLLNR